MKIQLKHKILSGFPNFTKNNQNNKKRKQSTVNTNKITKMLAMATILSVATFMPTLNQLSYAFPHSSLVIQNQGNFNPIRMVVGHSDEPTFAVSPGVHSGKHNLELSLTNQETLLPLTGASLKADMFYFNSWTNFDAATSVNDADEKKLNQNIGQIFGNPGFYTVREIQSEGIYGYRIYGTIDYFGVASVPIDTTIFCNSFDGNPTAKFNSVGWTGGFGCTPKADTITFPTIVLPTI